MTLDLDALEALEKKATQGPWNVSCECGDTYVKAGHKSLACDMHYYPWTFNNDDTEMLVAARNALPELIRLARIGQRVERDAKENG